jgi:hypothetical protein
MIGYGLVDRIISGCVDMECLYCLFQVISFKGFVVCACFVEGMSNRCDDFLFIILQWFLEMVSFTKVEEDRLVERMGDTKINEDGILEAKFSFPFVSNKLCVMRIMENN